MRQLSVSRPGCLVMLSSLSSALWMLQRIEGGGQQLRWQLWSSRHCPWWKEGTARELKDVGVMFAMKEYCAVTTPHWEPFIRHNDFTILWSRFLIWKVCTEWSLIWWSPIIPIVHWAVIPDVRITITSPCHDVTMSRSPRWWSCCWLSFQDARLLPGAGPLVDYVLQSYKSVGTLRALSLHLFSGLVIRHCPSPLLLFRLYSNHRLRFPVKNQLNNLPIGIG